MQAFTAEKTELLAAYGADEHRGLTTTQAQKNKEQYGENALTRRKPDSLLKRLWDAATEPMLLMLIAAGLIALAMNICLLYTSPSPRDLSTSRMPSSA